MYALLIYLSLHSLLFVEDLSKEGKEEEGNGMQIFLEKQITNSVPVLSYSFSLIYPCIVKRKMMQNKMQKGQCWHLYTVDIP